MTYNCLHCGGTFESRSETPAMCKLCKCKTWDTPYRKGSSLRKANRGGYTGTSLKGGIGGRGTVPGHGSISRRYG
jgi:hypothetical protein